MKYICLGYLEPGKFETMSESERNTLLDECFSYNDELRKNGHLVAEEPLQPAETAVTVGWKDGKVGVTDGPYAETKEQLGGIQVLELRDLNHAIQLISQSPGVKLKCGTIEIRPAADINEMIKESEQRRRRKDTSRRGRPLSEVKLFSERVHSELLDLSQISGDKYVFLFRATHSVLRTAASRAQYVESTPANQTMGSCASFVITKKSSSTSTMGQ